MFMEQENEERQEILPGATTKWNIKDKKKRQSRAIKRTKATKTYQSNSNL